MGYDDKKLVWGGGPAIGSPWSSLGEIVGRALAPYDYELTPDWGMSYNRGTRGNLSFIADGNADVGAHNPFAARWAYDGTFTFAKMGPQRSLRVIATIEFPSWIGVAVRRETWITDLSQIKERQLPVRVITGPPPLFPMIWDYYGLSREMIESWGGQFYDLSGAGTPRKPVLSDSWVRGGEFDMVMQTINAGNSPQMRCWQDSAPLFHLRFLPLPADLVRHICDELGGEPGFIPHDLYRGVDSDVPTISRPRHVILGNSTTPEDFGYLLAGALDKARHLFRETHLPFSYDPRTVAQSHGIPLHPGAERYYREVGYL